MLEGLCGACLRASVPSVARALSPPVAITRTRVLSVCFCPLQARGGRRARVVAHGNGRLLPSDHRPPPRWCTTGLYRGLGTCLAGIRIPGGIGTAGHMLGQRRASHVWLLRRICPENTGTPTGTSQGDSHQRRRARGCRAGQRQSCRSLPPRRDPLHSKGPPLRATAARRRRCDDASPMTADNFAPAAAEVTRHAGGTVRWPGRNCVRR